jgi:hypothetical protein
MGGEPPASRKLWRRGPGSEDALLCVSGGGHHSGARRAQAALAARCNRRQGATCRLMKRLLRRWGRLRVSGRQVKTDCSRSRCAGECQQMPTPALGRPPGWLAGVPRNLIFVCSRTRGRFNHSATMPGQRLLPLAANWDFRPFQDIDRSEFAAAKQSLESCHLCNLHAAVRAKHTIASGWSSLVAASPGRTHGPRADFAA